MVERELARGLIYAQTAMRLAQGHSVDTVAPTLSQSAPERRCALTLQQKMKQFDAARRVQWQQQMQVDSFD